MHLVVRQILLKNQSPLLPKSKLEIPIYAETNGRVIGIDTRNIGLAVLELGGGRKLVTDSIDYSVGFTHLAGLNMSVDSDNPIAIIHANDRNSAERATKLIQSSYQIGKSFADEYPVVLTKVSETKLH